MQNIKVSVVDTKPCAITLTVEVPHADVASETEKVYKQIQQAAQIPGFRQGKAPLDMVKKGYVATAREKVAENLIQRSAYSALKEQGVTPIDFPQIRDVVFDFNKPLTYTMKAEKHPEFKLKNYKGLKIKKEIYPVNEEKVRQTIESLRERNAALIESASDTVAASHSVIVDYDGMVDGKPADEFKTKNQMVDLSGAQFIPGFKEGLLGAKKGEEKMISVQFPAEHPLKKYAGKAVVFKAVVKEIKEKKLPDLDDEFAKDFGVATLAELEGKIKEKLDMDETARQKKAVDDQIHEQLLLGNVFEVPEVLVNEEHNRMMQSAEEYMKNNRMPPEEVQKAKERLAEEYKKHAADKVRLSYILRSIIDAEKIDATDEDLQKEYERIRTSNPGREKAVEQYIKEKQSNIKASVIEDKLISFLIAQAKVKESVVTKK